MKFQINTLIKKAPINPGPHPYYCGRFHMQREKPTAPKGSSWAGPHTENIAMPARAQLEREIQGEHPTKTCV